MHWSVYQKFYEWSFKHTLLFQSPRVLWLLPVLIPVSENVCAQKFIFQFVTIWETGFKTFACSIVPKPPVRTSITTPFRTGVSRGSTLQIKEWNKNLLSWLTSNFKQEHFSMTLKLLQWHFIRFLKYIFLLSISTFVITGEDWIHKFLIFNMCSSDELGL